MDEVRRLGALEGAEINHAKEVLAYEITKIVHGEAEADKALEASKALFGGAMDTKDIPTTTYPNSVFDEGIDLITLLCDGGLCQSRGDARRNITQGGVTVNDVKCTDFAKTFSTADLNSDGALLIKRGKKAFHLYKPE